MNYVLYEHDRPVPSYCAQVLARFGKNPYGEPLFRIAWAPSIKEINGGKWNDNGAIEYRLTPRYSSECYILEKWLPTTIDPQDFEEATLSDGLLSIGPFPSRGTYEECYSFQHNGVYVPLDPSLINMVANLIDAGKALTKLERFLAIREREEKKEKATKQKVSDIVDDAQSPFKGLALGYGGSAKVKKAEDVVIKYSANDLPASMRRPGFRQF